MKFNKGIALFGTILLLSAALPFGIWFANQQDTYNNRLLEVTDRNNETPAYSLVKQHKLADNSVSKNGFTNRDSQNSSPEGGVSYVEREMRRVPGQPAVYVDGSNDFSAKNHLRRSNDVPYQSAITPVINVGNPQRLVAQTAPFQGSDIAAYSDNTQEPPIAYVGPTGPEPPGAPIGSGLGALLLFSALYGFKKR